MVLITFQIKCNAACLCNYTIRRVVQLEKSFLKLVSFNCFSLSAAEHCLSFKQNPNKTKQLKYLVSKKSSLLFPDWLIYESISWPARRISRLVADAQMEVEEMLCESYSQRIGKFHQNEIVLTICHLSSLIDNHIEEAEKLNMDAVKTEHFQRDIKEKPMGLFLV